jgi:hypothetical protein
VRTGTNGNFYEGIDFRYQAYYAAQGQTVAGSPAFQLARDGRLGARMINTDYNNFAPRFGFSYRLDAAGKTVLRGGWGIYYSHYSGNIPGDLSRGPYAATTVITNNIVNGSPQFTLANPFTIAGAPGTIALSAVAPHLLNSYTQQYSLSLERELTRDIGLRVSYIGSKGSQIAYRRDVNQPVASTVAFSNAL